MGKDKPDNKKYQDYDDSFGTYVWDSATGKFFGRTGIAWSKKNKSYSDLIEILFVT